MKHKSNKNPKVLVTGGAGYIGSILVPTLLHSGFDVTVIDNFMYRQTPLLDHCHLKHLDIVKGDTRDDKLLKKYIPKADIIIPLACIVGAPACDKDPLKARSVNLDAIVKILKIKSPSQLVIYPNTNSGYGVGQKGIYCNEKTPLNPISLYGKLKVQAEEAVLSSKNSITLRLATVFGLSPRMRLDLLVNDFVHRAVNDRFLVLFEAHFKRNYVHIRDVASAFMHSIENFNRMKGQPYNVGLSKANLSKWELCHEIKKQVPEFYFHEAEIGEDPDKRNYIVSNAKIEATGFKTKISLQEGIAELIKGYRIISHNNFTNV
ncbi:MAG: NAD(P)-dependent oxidoreductase [Candidatus Yanofskybacteria bacterium]|nr:NAD(P)-dependent oxidoreductase [Candidatus Yanofskybacteria bacterium]